MSRPRALHPPLHRLFQTLFLLCLAWVQPTQALEVNDLYEATVTVAGRSQAQQAKGMSDAYRVVIGKVAGSAPQPAAMAALLKKTQQHVRSYAYLGGNGQAMSMQVSFDRVAVDAALQAAGIPVWGSNRPLVLLWLALEESGQRRIVSADSDPLIAQRIRAHVGGMGTPVNLPLYDLQDMSTLGVADVWGEFDERIRAASAQYRADLIATARIDAENGTWRGRWTLSTGGETARTTTSGQTRDDALQAGLDWISARVRDTYAGAAAASGVPGAGLTLVVKGVRDIAAHAALTGLLTSSVVIRAVALERVEGDRVTFSVVPAASTDTLMQGLLSGGRLSLPEGTGEAQPQEEGVIHFDWRG